MRDEIELAVEWVHPFCLIRLTGELTTSEIPWPEGARPWDATDTSHTDGVAGNRCEAILLDMTRLTYCNSAGIAWLIRYIRTARNHGVSAVAFGVSPHYQKIFRIVGLTQYMEIFADEYGTLETLRARGDLLGS